VGTEFEAALEFFDQPRTNNRRFMDCYNACPEFKRQAKAIVGHIELHKHVLACQVCIQTCVVERLSR
jgi:hypothetical protein